MELIGYISSILIGISLGLIGSGGSILTVPVLVYMFGVDAVIATSYSLFIVGFTSGIALIIFSSQVKDFLGLPIQNLPPDFVDKWLLYGTYLGQINWTAFAIALGTVLLSLNFHRISKKIPGSIIVILLSTAIVYFFKLPVETIESKFGEIPNKISIPTVPGIDFTTIKLLIQPAIAIALLGSIESLLSAVVADGMIGGRHRSNMELVAQGASNIFSGLFGGIPVTGAIARTATNIKNGGRTPIAGIVHALILLLIMLLLAPVAKLIPLSCLAGILVVVAWHMGEWHHFFSMMKSNRMDVLVLLTSFFLTVFFDLIIAIEIGMILSSFIFMKRMSEATSIKTAGNLLEPKAENEGKLFEEELSGIPKNVLIYEINGPLFFGASQKFQEVITDLNKQPEILILRMRYVPFIDATGINRLKEMCKQLLARGTKIIISEANHEVRHEMLKAQLYAIIDKHNFVLNINDALKKSEELKSKKK